VTIPTRVVRSFALLAVCAAPAGLRAFVPRLTPADVERALAVAREPAAERARFTARYVLPLEETLNETTVERLEIVTPFRRAELFGEDRLRIGDHMFGARAAERAIASAQGRVTIRAALRFNPQNVYVTVPDFSIIVGDGAPGGVRVDPLNASRTPVFGPGIGRRGSKGQPILGATIEADYDAAAIGQQTWPVGVWLGRTRYAAAAVRFGEID